MTTLAVLVADGANAPTDGLAGWTVIGAIVTSLVVTIAFQSLWGLLVGLFVPLAFLAYQSLQSGSFDFGYAFDWSFGNYWEAIDRYHEHLLRSLVYAGLATLIALVSDVLDVARFDTGKIELQESVFPLGGLLAEEGRQLLP